HVHIAVGISTLVAEPRQAALPVRRQQAKRVPPLTPPRVRDVAAFEDDVIDRAVSEAPTCRQAGMARADDDRGDAFDRQSTSTVTLVGLVTMSYTADRFCDCATIASTSFLGASASILNVTLISS